MSRGGENSRRGAGQAPAEQLSLTVLGQMLQGTAFGVICQDRDLRVVWVRNLPALLAKKALPGASDADFLPHDHVQALADMKHAALSDGGHRHLEISTGSGSDERHFALLINVDESDDAGARHSVYTTVVDMTERWRHEETQKALLREVSHRSRNLLAIVQGIASQTARHAPSIEEFLARFRGRLQSLALSQDLVTSSDWRGANLRAILHGQVSQLGAKPGENVVFEGEDPYLNPNAVLYLGLAFHELAVNSTNYGALSRREEPVRVSTSFPSRADSTQLSISWAEPLSTDAPRLIVKHFGGVALEKVVPASLDGSASWSIEDDRLLYVLTIPLSNLTRT